MLYQLSYRGKCVILYHAMKIISRCVSIEGVKNAEPQMFRVLLHKNDAVAKWPNAAVCKTAIRGFDSRLRLQSVH